MSSNEPRKIRVGIIGASPDRGWAADAHIPALKSLSEPDRQRLVGKPTWDALEKRYLS